MFAFMKDIQMPALPASRKCYFDQPTATHIERVEAYLVQDQFEPFTNEALRLQSFMYKKYHDKISLMECKSADLKILLDTAKANMRLVKKFQENKSPYDTRYQVCEGLFKTVTIQAVEKVTLLVGDRSLMKFKLNEAEEHLKQEIVRLVIKLKMYRHDIDYLREQLTNTKTNLTRIHSFSTEVQKLYMQPSDREPSTFNSF